MQSLGRRSNGGRPRATSPPVNTVQQVHGGASQYLATEFVDPTQVERDTSGAFIGYGSALQYDKAPDSSQFRPSDKAAPESPPPPQFNVANTSNLLTKVVSAVQSSSPAEMEVAELDLPLLGGLQPRMRTGVRDRTGRAAGGDRNTLGGSKPRPSSEYVRIGGGTYGIDWRGEWPVDDRVEEALTRSWAPGSSGNPHAAALTAAAPPLSPVTGPRRSNSSFRLDIDELWRVAAASARAPQPPSPTSPARPSSPLLVALAALRALDGTGEEGGGKRVPSLGRIGRAKDKWDGMPGSPAGVPLVGMRESPSMRSIRSISMRVRATSTPPRNRNISGFGANARSVSPPPRPSEDMDLGIDPDLARAVFAVAAGGKLAVTGWGEVPSPKRGPSPGAGPGLAYGSGLGIPTQSNLTFSTSYLGAAATDLWSNQSASPVTLSTTVPPRNASLWKPSFLPTRAPYLVPPPNRSPPPALSSPTPPSPPKKYSSTETDVVGMVPSASSVSVMLAAKARPAVGWKVAGSVTSTINSGGESKNEIVGTLISEGVEVKEVLGEQAYKLKVSTVFDPPGSYSDDLKSEGRPFLSGDNTNPLQETDRGSFDDICQLDRPDEEEFKWCIADASKEENSIPGAFGIEKRDWSIAVTGKTEVCSGEQLAGAPPVAEIEDNTVMGATSLTEKASSEIDKDVTSTSTTGATWTQTTENTLDESMERVQTVFHANPTTVRPNLCEERTAKEVHDDGDEKGTIVGGITMVTKNLSHQVESSTTSVYRLSEEEKQLQSMSRDEESDNAKQMPKCPQSSSEWENPRVTGVTGELLDPQLGVDGMNTPLLIAHLPGARGQSITELTGMQQHGALRDQSMKRVRVPASHEMVIELSLDPEELRQSEPSFQGPTPPLTSRLNSTLPRDNRDLRSNTLENVMELSKALTSSSVKTNRLEDHSQTQNQAPIMYNKDLPPLISEADTNALTTNPPTPPSRSNRSRVRSAAAAAHTRSLSESAAKSPAQRERRRRGRDADRQHTAMDDTLRQTALILHPDFEPSQSERAPRGSISSEAAFTLTPPTPPRKPGKQGLGRKVSRALEDGEVARALGSVLEGGVDMNKIAPPIPAAVDQDPLPPVEPVPPPPPDREFSTIMPLRAGRRRSSRHGSLSTSDRATLSPSPTYSDRSSQSQSPVEHISHSPTPRLSESTEFSDSEYPPNTKIEIWDGRQGGRRSSSERRRDGSGRRSHDASRSRSSSRTRVSLESSLQQGSNPDEPFAIRDSRRERYTKETSVERRDGSATGTVKERFRPRMPKEQRPPPGEVVSDAINVLQIGQKWLEVPKVPPGKDSRPKRSLLKKAKGGAERRRTVYGLAFSASVEETETVAASRSGERRVTFLDRVVAHVAPDWDRWIPNTKRLTEEEFEELEEYVEELRRSCEEARRKAWNWGRR
ncbi:hypothetical protein HDU93_008000 [Gonapodya sp. JEL0774]|nr:hypothetical protein HDU93_008000 [Gonapodya sp. JEL0774]